MARRTRHPSYRLTDEEYDRFDSDGINDPLPAHLRAPEGTDCLAVFAAQVEATREANERTWDQ